MTDDTTDDNGETNHNLNESADKIVLKTKVVRGSGTRDQDKLDVKVKGNDPTHTVDKLNAVLDRLEDTGTAGALRSTQPEVDDE
jgi:hypothetical protein